MADSVGSALLVMLIRFAGERIAEIDAVADADRLSTMGLTVPLLEVQPSRAVRR